MYRHCWLSWNQPNFTEGNFTPIFRNSEEVLECFVELNLYQMYLVFKLGT